jgi:hypothetical protein
MRNDITSKAEEKKKLPKQVDIDCNNHKNNIKKHIFLVFFLFVILARLCINKIAFLRSMSYSQEIRKKKFAFSSSSNIYVNE